MTTRYVPMTTRRAPKDIDAYIGGFSPDVQSILERIRATVHAAAPGAEEIISYRIPAFKQKVILVWFAVFANHCSLFPTASVIAKFKAELKGYSASKGTLQFPLAKPLPVALIKRIVKARVAEVKAERLTQS